MTITVTITTGARPCGVAEFAKSGDLMATTLTSIPPETQMSFSVSAGNDVFVQELPANGDLRAFGRTPPPQVEHPGADHEEAA